MSSPTSTSSSLSSSKRFGLNETDRSKILVYKHPIGLSMSSQQDLCKELDNDRNLRCSKLPIPWGNSHVNIRQKDLFPERDRTQIGDKPSMNLSLASINLGRLGHFKRLVGMYRDLYIVSPEQSPSSSPTSSQQITPNSTFKHDDDATHGAPSNSNKAPAPVF